MHFIASCDVSITVEQDDGCSRRNGTDKNQRHWLEQIQACEASGKSVAAYASAHGFPVRAMYDAKKVLVKKGVLPRTLGARFQRAQAKVVGGEWRIQLPSGVSVEFSGTVDAGSLSAVLTMVAQLG